MRASLLIQGQISYFFIGQGGLVRFSYFILSRLGAPLPWGVIEELLNTTLNDICNREYGIAVSKYKLSIKAKKFINNLYYNHNINLLAWSHHYLDFYFSASYFGLIVVESLWRMKKTIIKYEIMLIEIYLIYLAYLIT
ncbi:hypothetical protein EJN90_03230 [Jeotgalibaca ciconiae]|uniref:Uncharacterized protein n=1 Tax=Jeotgalibaca ciconiae TaxID=2496265 RepID=A0A3S9H8U2_9LACT|nr:hypothetical protein EJN90_03230 [Jeotgalibaca ciconiae]